MGTDDSVAGHEGVALGTQLVGGARLSNSGVGRSLGGGGPESAEMEEGDRHTNEQKVRTEKTVHSHWADLGRVTVRDLGSP